MGDKHEIKPYNWALSKYDFVCDCAHGKSITNEQRIH